MFFLQSMVGKSGFIRDPSGLLMSVIRTLEDHTDERHRDLEREKLEEAYSDIDQKLDNAVEGNFKEIKSTIEVRFLPRKLLQTRFSAFW